MVTMPRKKKPVKLFTLDTETVGLGGDIRRIAIYDGETVHYGYKFADVEPVLIAASKDYKVHVYIHNMNFDLRKTPEVFREGNVRWNMCLAINRRYTTLVCQEYTFHDSWQLIQTSLDKASKDFELEHGKLDLWDAVEKRYPGKYKDKVDFLSHCNVDDELYLEYLGYDVISLYELMYKLIEVSTIPLEDFVKCPTTASMSKYLLKHGYGGKPFKDENHDKTDYEYFIKNKYWLSEKPLKEFPEVNYLQLEYKMREGYAGGRTEVFTPVLKGEPDKINGYHYDVNSLYPYVCYTYDYPIGVPEFFNKEYMIKYKWRFWLKHKIGLGFMKCEVFVPKQKIPPLPSKLEKLSFFTGHIEGTWTFVELEYAIKNCGVKITKVHEMIYFKETYPVYRNFIKTFADMKEKADKEKNMSLRTFCKFIMNTAYGWSCMSRDDKTEFDYIDKAEKYIKDGRLIATDKKLGFIEVKSIVRSDTIQVQIGSYVASYARLVLLDALRRQAEKGEVYYCDTDSVVCEAPMTDDMIHNSKLGFWGLENVLKQGLFLQPKVYTEVTVDDTTNIKFKGVTKQRQSEFDFSFYEELYQSLCSKSPGKRVVEENVERLHGLVTAHKNGLDVNEVVVTSKEMNLEAVQKRNIDYRRNKSEAWHMDSISMFRSFRYANLQRGDYFEKRR